MIMANDHDATEVLTDNLERLATEELMDWAQGMDYFGDPMAERQMLAEGQRARCNPRGLLCIRR